MRFTYNAAGAAALLSCAAVLTGTSALQAGDVTYERLLKPEPQNWLMNHRDFGSHRFSPLETINKSNVKNSQARVRGRARWRFAERIHRSNAAGR